MKRGEIWTVAGGPDYAAKPRPAAILQDDRFDATASVTLVPLTTDDVPMPLFRLPVQPSKHNGLKVPCQIMVDKITTVSRSKLGKRIGQLGDEDLLQLNRSVLVFLGIAG